MKRSVAERQSAFVKEGVRQTSEEVQCGPRVGAERLAEDGAGAGGEGGKGRGRVSWGMAVVRNGQALARKRSMAAVLGMWLSANR